MVKQCQSRGMPLQTKKAGNCRGTESDGSSSDTWCKLCYENGELINPDCTLDEMRVIVENALKENGSGKLMRWMAQQQLPRLERWKVQE